MTKVVDCEIDLEKLKLEKDKIDENIKNEEETIEKKTPEQAETNNFISETE